MSSTDNPQSKPASSQKSVITVALAGTGPYSVQCAEALAADSRFEVIWVLTPAPKPVGRHQKLTSSPLHDWAQAQQVDYFLVENSLQQLQEKLLSAPTIDFLLVVSFGYLLPAWLLDLPRLAPVNVHPSDLPLFRGSSPGQFVLLYGQAKSAVSIIKMNNKFDQGEIITKLPLNITATATTKDYYQQAFTITAQNLPTILEEYAQTLHSHPQTDSTSTFPMARRLSRQDGFINQAILRAAQTGKPFPSQPSKAKIEPNTQLLGPVLAELRSHQPDLTPAQLIDRAWRALTPWPGIWTVLDDFNGKKQQRLKILNIKYLPDKDQIKITKYQPAGDTPRQENLNL